MAQVKLRSTTRRRGSRTFPKDPTSGGKPVLPFKPADDVEHHRQRGDDVLHEGLAPVRAVKDAVGAVAILDVGGVYFDSEESSAGIGQRMTLAAPDRFRGIEAACSPL